MSAKKKPKSPGKIDTSELEKKLSPARLKLYREIMELRESIGPITKTTTEIVREMRGDDD